MKKISVFAAIIIAIVAVAVVWTRPQTISVRVVEVETGLVESTVANTRAGSIKACRRSKLSLLIGGTVAELNVSEGDHVDAGQVLLRLWDKDRQARATQASATLKVAELRERQACVTARLDQRESSRLETLAKQKLASENVSDVAKTRATASQLACDAARSEVEVARSNQQLQEALLEQTFLRAPFAGIVAEINGEVGEFVTPSPPGVATPPAVDLLDDNCLYVTAPIDEVDASEIRVGMPARITMDAFRGRQFAGTVTRIAPYVLELAKQARTVDIDVKFDERPEDIHLLAGYSADIEVIVEDRDDVLRVPSDSVLEGNKVLVYQQESGTITEKAFSAGIQNWTYTEVVDGLVEGDQIVTSLDVDGLVDGARVSIEDSDSQ